MDETPSADFIGTYSQQVRQCVSEILKEIEGEKRTIENYEKISKICAWQTYYALLYNDFKIRRDKFTQQSLDERVNLFMVVAITLLGVALSAVQLWISYRIFLVNHATVTDNIDLTIKGSEISVKSSTIGIAILVISLAFFVVYVNWIYRQDDKGQPLGMPPENRYVPMGQNLGMGNLSLPMTMDNKAVLSSQSPSPVGAPAPSSAP